jgi:hypothetical protein
MYPPVNLKVAVACELLVNMCAPIIQRVCFVVRRGPCSWGCINDSWVPIIQSNVFLCVNSERKDPGKEDRDEEAQVDDHGW